jgi:hypothetical protein
VGRGRRVVARQGRWQGVRERFQGRVCRGSNGAVGVGVRAEGRWVEAGRDEAPPLGSAAEVPMSVSVHVPYEGAFELVEHRGGPSRECAEGLSGVEALFQAEGVPQLVKGDQHSIEVGSKGQIRREGYLV